MSPLQRHLYRWVVRPTLPSAQRRFFEGIPGVAGQLYRAERQALHDAIVRRAPRFAFEIGTFNGGGSTYFQAGAFAELGRGTLVTLELDPVLNARAMELYRSQLPQLRHHVEFLLGGDPALFEPFLQKAGSAEFVFLDGAENGEQTLQQYRYFEPWFRPGSMLALHDWNTEKMRLVRQILTGSPRWRCELELHEPDSIGFALFAMT